MKFAIAIASLLIMSLCAALEPENIVVGVQPDGRIQVPTNQMLKPAGKQITFPGRPVDLCFSSDGSTLIVKNTGDLIFIDLKETKIAAILPLGGKIIGETPTQGKIYEGMSVTGLQNAGNKIYVTDADNSIRIAERPDAGAAYVWSKPIALPAPKVTGKAHPAGLWLAGAKLWVTSTRGNCVYCFDIAKKAAELSIPTGVAPFTVCFVSPSKGYVSNWGGDAPKSDDEPQALTSKTPARIDPRTSVVNDGSVSVITQLKGDWVCPKSIKVGLHPSALLASAGGKFLYVANANSDTVSVIDTSKDEVVETIACKPEARLPFGSGSDALALSPDGATLYVANASNNCIAVVKLGAKSQEPPANAAAASSLEGLIPTGWYPGAVLVSPDGKKLFVANIKGHGLLAERRVKEKGRASGDYLGSVSIIDVPDAKQLADYTKTVNENNRLAQSLSGLDAPRADAKPVPVPERHGEPSVFKHVIYVIRENKTYDQVFGDMTEGNGEKSLCIFPEEITPNGHALAREFVLFDNFYCSGAKSPDGHAWVNQAYVTDYLERAYGGFARSYPYEGSDPLAFAATGYLWDNALAYKKTFRNYGEFCKTTYTPVTAKWADVYADYKNGTAKINIAVEPNLQSLKPWSHPGYPGFPLTTPDVYRAKLFIEELKGFEQKGEFPNLVYVYLPQDHTSGTAPGNPTPRAMVADNDLALGQIVEAVTASKFWADTCMVIVEDDPQSGYDHIDAHRTIALIVSPYTKRKFVDHANYTQPGMVKTIELMLGLPPMTQLDLSAPAMRTCFQPQPDLTPFKCLPAKVAIDELNPPLNKLKGAALKWAKKSIELSFAQADEADDDDLNEVLWHAMKGDGVPYPKQYAADDEK